MERRGAEQPRGLPLLLCAALLLATPAAATVYEVANDGSLAVIDVPVATIGPQHLTRDPQRPSRRTVRADAFAPVVAAAAEHYALSPALVDAIAATESAYDPQAVSPKNAKGIMQLMPGTAAALGVDRDDPVANIRGGTAYLRALLDRFDGDLVRTIAAYNAGPTAVVRAGRRGDGVPDFAETRRYVATVLDRLALAAR